MNRILSLIVISQFFCTTLWFAGNTVVPDISKSLDLDGSFLGHITIISIQSNNYIFNKMDSQYVYLFLSIGPVLGIIALIGNRSIESIRS